MKLLSLFSGIGAFEKALDKLNIGYELVGLVKLTSLQSNHIAQFIALKNLKILGT